MVGILPTFGNHSLSREVYDMRGLEVFDLVDNFVGMVVQVQLAKLKAVLGTPLVGKQASLVFRRTTDAENLVSLLVRLPDKACPRKGITADDDYSVTHFSVSSLQVQHQDMTDYHLEIFCNLHTFSWNMNCIISKLLAFSSVEAKDSMCFHPH